MSFYKLSQNEKIIMPKKANNPAILDILHNFTYTLNLQVEFAEDETLFTVGNPTPCDLCDEDYVINVTEEGAYVKGKDYKSAIKGFLSLLEMVFCYGKDDYRIDCVCKKESAKIPFRAVHICIFPENTVEELRKVIRVCGVTKYSHVILEPWGSVQLETLKELSWPNSIPKSEIKELVAEANALGMEVIPFFQHLGHAALARLGYAGKHTVLDQNLALEHLFYPRSYGWVWNFKNDETKALLKAVRKELCDLFGEGEYFHLGCDESGMEFEADELCEWLNEVQADLKEQGRRAIVWGDMLLSKAFFPEEETDPRRPWTIRYECNSTPEYANALCEGLSKDIIIADWQYNVESAPWKSSVLLKNKGFDVICCPWDLHDNIPAAVSTVKDSELLGIMETTWNKLLPGIKSIVYAGFCAWGDPQFAGWFDGVSDRASNIVRRTAPEGKTYESSGWSKNQI